MGRIPLRPHALRYARKIASAFRQSCQSPGGRAKLTSDSPALMRHAQPPPRWGLVCGNIKHASRARHTRPWPRVKPNFNRARVRHRQFTVPRWGNLISRSIATGDTFPPLATRFTRPNFVSRFLYTCDADMATYASRTADNPTLLSVLCVQTPNEPSKPYIRTLISLRFQCTRLNVHAFNVYFQRNVSFKRKRFHAELVIVRLNENV